MRGTVAKRLRKQEGWLPSFARDYRMEGEGRPRWYKSTQNTAVVPAHVAFIYPEQMRKIYYTPLMCTGTIHADAMRKNYKEAKRQHTSK